MLGCKENNIDFFGYDLNRTNSDTMIGCMQDCMNNLGCQFWTLDKKQKLCFLKKEGAVDNRTSKDGIVSGTKLCPGNIGKC